MKRIILIGLASACIVAALYMLILRFQASAPPDVQAAAKKSQPESNIDITNLEAKAAQGDSIAQSELGRAYAQGLGVKLDYKVAAHWYGLAASNGNAEAEEMYGELCQAGQGVPRDLAAAQRWFTKASQDGSIGAQYDLGYMYEQGRGVKQDEKLAAHWYQLAAEGGDVLAQYDYGQRCVLGVGVTQDLVEGLKWLLLAEAQGQPDARKKADAAQKKMTSQEISEAKRRAKAFTPRVTRP
jgi:TPR repeat protein